MTLKVNRRIYVKPVNRLSEGDRASTVIIGIEALKF